MSFAAGVVSSWRNRLGHTVQCTHLAPSCASIVSVIDRRALLRDGLEEDLGPSRMCAESGVRAGGRCEFAPWGLFHIFSPWRMPAFKRHGSPVRHPRDPRRLPDVRYLRDRLCLRSLRSRLDNAARDERGGRDL